MKDLNELMQSILDMDIAQRKATEHAMAERKAAMDALAGKKAQIEQQYTEKATQAADDVMRKQAQKCDAVLAGLRKKKEAEAKHMAAAAAAQKDSWAQMLAQRALEG
ncbi:MAG: hypothetical protein LKJ90_01010 [Faecalibacterium sp.]|jgi:formate dehydrogenase maturation protein FdhE|nr:hypothetical protein [Faecalibacterium sp.]